MTYGLPLVSVVTVNRNGMKFMDDCVGSVLNSRYPDFEFIFVDNASADGSLQYVKNKYGQDSRLKFIENSQSCGPAFSRNQAGQIARGRYLVFLDYDTRVEPDWLGQLVKVLEADASIGGAQAKILSMDTPRIYDCAGDLLGPLGFLIERSAGAKDTGQFDFTCDILSAKTAASIIRKDVFSHIGGFDPDYYMYLEETDLCWRVWLAGYRVVFVPGSVVWHAFNTPRKDMKSYSKYLVRYYGCRNYISTLVKNLELKNLFRFLPLHICAWLAMSVLFLLKGGLVDFFYILKGMFWNILNLDLLICKREAINRDIRKVGDEAILSVVGSKDGVLDYIRKIRVYLTDLG